MIDPKGLQLEFCAAERDDIPAILEQCRALIYTYEDLESIDISKVMSWVENKICTCIDQYVCVKKNGCKVAYYHLDIGCGEVELDDLYVLPEFRGKGIGEQILQKCIQSITSPIFLYVFRENIGAIRFYQRFGFVIAQSVGSTRLIMRRDY